MRLYMDDDVIMAHSYEEVLQIFQEVLERASRYGLEIKWPKCQVLVKKVDSLGYEVYNGIIKPSPVG